LPKLQAFNPWIALLRRHKALIPPKNVLYIKKFDEDDKTPPATCSPSGALFFGGDVPRVWIIEGVKPTRQQWQENRVRRLRKVLPA
jgi:hypothetical protein